MTGATVCLHAFVTTRHGTTYADADMGEPFDGWSVYTRHDQPEGGFDTSDERDFTTRDAAEAEAERRAEALGVPVDAY